MITINIMALITSDCGAMRFLENQMALITSDFVQVFSFGAVVFNTDIYTMIVEPLDKVLG